MHVYQSALPGWRVAKYAHDREGAVIVPLDEAAGVADPEHAVVHVDHVQADDGLSKLGLIVCDGGLALLRLGLRSEHGSLCFSSNSLQSALSTSKASLNFKI